MNSAKYFSVQLLVKNIIESKSISITFWTLFNFKFVIYNCELTHYHIGRALLLGEVYCTSFHDLPSSTHNAAMEMIFLTLLAPQQSKQRLSLQYFVRFA